MERDMKSSSKNEPTNFDCGVCLNLMTEPAKLPCNHYFCLECLERVLAVDDLARLADRHPIIISSPQLT